MVECTLCKQSSNLRSLKFEEFDTASAPNLVQNVFALLQIEENSTIQICNTCMVDLELVSNILKRWKDAHDEHDPIRLLQQHQKNTTETELRKRCTRKRKQESEIENVVEADPQDHIMLIDALDKAINEQENEIQTDTIEQDIEDIDRTKPIAMLHTSEYNTKLAEIFEANPDSNICDTDNDDSSVSNIKLVCATCQQTYSTWRNLQKHIKQQHITPLYSCSNCLVAYTNAAELKAHHRTSRHYGMQILDAEDLQDVKYTCEYCQRHFTQMHGIWRHYTEVHHWNRERLKCSDCGATFKYKTSFQNHLAGHMGLRTYPYKCEICDKSFKTTFEKRSHMRIHTDERPFACEYCAKRFRHRCNYLVHLRIHMNQLPYECDICSVQFRTSSHLKRHQQSHKGREKLAKEAKKPGKSADDTNAKAKIAEKKVNQSLINHIKQDSLLKIISGSGDDDIQQNGNSIQQKMARYRCTYCDKAFALRSSYTKHLRTHTGEQPYKCPYCARCFADPTNFKRHKLTKHADILVPDKVDEESLSSASDAESIL